MLWCALYFLIAVVSADDHSGEVETTEPENMACLPTSVVQGPCHICVCRDDGAYQCRAKNCDVDQNSPKVKEKVIFSDSGECDPHIIYRDEFLWCTCSHLGFWKSKNCRSNFKIMKSNTLRQSQMALPNVTCESNHYYAVDCNVCHCQNGKLQSCTSRNCVSGHKADECTFGQMLRSEKELCACSETGYYVDKLCINLSDDKIASLGKKELSILTFESQMMKDKCKPKTVIKIDCNRCICSDSGYLMCTDKLCLSSGSHSLASQKVSRLRAHQLYSKQDLQVLKSEDEACTPGQYYRYHCNTCYCTRQGTPSCTTMLCMDDFKPQNTTIKDVALSETTGREDIPQNVLKTTHENLQEIHKGEKCVAGNVYKIECNICKCTNEKRLLCTKSACLDVEETDKLKEYAKKKRKQKKDLYSSNLYPHVMRSKGKKLRTEIKPTNKCEPGKVLNRGCQRCFCTDRKISVCTNRPCNEIKDPAQTPNDIGPNINVNQFDKLPSLPHEAAECLPGKTYRVDCNACRCLANKNMICDKKLCPSVGDVNRIAASKYNGKECTDKSEPTECVKCDCKNGKTDCNPEVNCVPGEIRRWLHGPNMRAVNDHAINADGQECLSGMVYKQSCNRCYCQDDGTLRCTRKGCLNFQQVERLKKQRDRLLKKEGLL